MSSGWDDVTIIRKRPEGSKALKSDGAVNSARRTGGAVSTEKKTVSNANHVGIEAGKAARIDNETEDFHVQRVDVSVGKAIAQGRMEKKLTQKELATKINEKPQIVNEYESGKAVNPNQQILAKMERVLGIKLRGKGIGTPLAGPGSKK